MRWRRGLLVGVTVLALAVMAACAGMAGVAAEPDQPGEQETPEMTLRLLVEQGGDDYAGDCAATTSPADVGKVCARLIDEQDGTRAYLIGRTFSEFTTWVFVREDAEGWAVVATAPLDFVAMELTIPWP